jgi:hypothetical protein
MEVSSLVKFVTVHQDQIVLQIKSSALFPLFLWQRLGTPSLVLCHKHSPDPLLFPSQRNLFFLYFFPFIVSFLSRQDSETIPCFILPELFSFPKWPSDQWTEDQAVSRGNV